MNTIDTSSVLHFFQSLWQLVHGALWFDPQAFLVAQENPASGWVILAILFLAGVSTELGQSVVLLANKVTPRRFVASLLFGGVIFILEIGIWVCSIWVMSTYVFQASMPILDLWRVVGLACAPLLFGFFVLLPYAGTFVDHLLDVWSLVVMIFALVVTLHLDVWQAFLCALLGWLLIQLLERTIGRPVVRVYHWSQQLVAGTALSVHRGQDILQVAVKDKAEDLTKRQTK
jgi:hypothetical protein